MAQLGQDYLGTFQLGPVTLNIQESEVIFANGLDIDTARMSVTFSSGTADLYLGLSNTWDGVYSWEQVTNNVNHTFSNSGKFLKWKVQGASAVISRIEVQANS